MADEDGNIEMDMASAMAEMDSTFGGGGEGAAEVTETTAAPTPASPTPAPGTPPTAVPQPAPGQVAPTPEPWRSLPSSWKKEHAPHWSKFDPAMQQYIHTREQQFIDGVTQYKRVAEPYMGLEKNYEPWLKHYNVQMPQVVERMMNSHLALLQAPEELKQKYLESLIKDYNLQPLLQRMYGAAPAAGGEVPAGGIPQEVQQRFQQYEQSIADLGRRLQSYEAAEQQRALEASQSAVDAFIADPQNEFAAEVLPDMVELVRSGLATDLKAAYDKAVWNNPSVRAKLMEREIAKAASPKVPTPRNVRSGATPPASTKPKDESIDETMLRVLEDINSRSA